MVSSRAAEAVDGYGLARSTRPFIFVCACQLPTGSHAASLPGCPLCAPEAVLRPKFRLAEQSQHTLETSDPLTLERARFHRRVCPIGDRKCLFSDESMSAENSSAALNATGRAREAGPPEEIAHFQHIARMRLRSTNSTPHVFPSLRTCVYREPYLS